MITWTTERRKLSDLIPWPRNPRKTFEIGVFMWYNWFAKTHEYCAIISDCISKASRRVSWQTFTVLGLFLEMFSIKGLPMNTETWVSISGYEGLYEVSSWGRVRSLWGKSRAHKLTADGVMHLNNANKDYSRITLSHGDMRRKTHLVHRLVAENFIGVIPEGMDVNHKDGNKLNNRMDNLEIVTKMRNSQHAVELGLLKVCGENNPCAKLTGAQVREIKILVNAGHKKAHIAQKFGVSGGLITMIAKGAIWRSVTV